MSGRAEGDHTGRDAADGPSDDPAGAVDDEQVVVADDLDSGGLGLDRVVATVVRLLDRSLVRVGNDRYAAENETFGGRWRSRAENTLVKVLAA